MVKPLVREDETQSVKEIMARIIESAPDEETKKRLYDECAVAYMAAFNTIRKMTETNEKLNTFMDATGGWRERRKIYKQIMDMQPLDSYDYHRSPDLKPFGSDYIETKILRLFSDIADGLDDLSKRMK